MRFGFKQLMIIGILAALLFSSFTIAYGADPYGSYTYNYWGYPVPAPQAYLPSRTIDGHSLGIGSFNVPMDLFVTTDNRIIIVDSGNHRLVILNEQWEVVQVIRQFSNNGQMDSFNNPSGVYVNDDNEIYVADTNNGRIVHLDSSGEFVRELGAPSSDVLPADFVYRPTQLVLDKAQRLYVVAQGVNRGIIELDSDGVFRGYMGANRVSPNMIDYFWRLIATDAQRERLEMFVPTEYNNIAIDDDGFVYVTTSALSRWDILGAIASRSDDDRVAPVRKLNPTGTDVLRRQGFFPPVGDVMIPMRGSEQGASQLVDVVVEDYGIYSVLDRRRGRIFTYDSDSNLLFLFGGNGNRMGNFRNATALEIVNGKFIVLDSVLAQVTVFDPTEYGLMVREAVVLHHRGRYEESAERWSEVLRLNANADLAYIGMGKAYMRQDDFSKAMRSFRLGNKREYYTRAFQLYRKEVIGQNFGWIMTGIFILIAALKFRKYKKRRFNMEEVND